MCHNSAYQKSRANLMKIKFLPLLSLLGFLTLGSIHAQADVTLPRVLNDGAVIQRDKPITIWGWADEGEAVTVTFAGKNKNTIAKDGSWSVKFPALKAGGD